MNKSDFDFGVLKLVLNMANDTYDYYLIHRKDLDPNKYHATQTLLHYMRINGFDKTDLLTARAPAVEQYRNGLNEFCESYAQGLVVACLSYTD